jgi:hypothetical protein
MDQGTAERAQLVLPHQEALENRQDPPPPVLDPGRMWEGSARKSVSIERNCLTLNATTGIHSLEQNLNSRS